MSVISSNPLLEDIKISFKESRLVFPSQETEKRSFFLSNVDQILNYNVLTLHFFSENPDYPPEQVLERLKLALERVLVPYDFMAGRLKLNEESGRLEIDCNAAGAGFVVATSELSLDEIGDLVCPNVGFQQLALQTLVGPNKVDDAHHPLFILQVTSFRCGGFAIGMSVNHILLDGFSAKDFTENLASQTLDEKPLAVVPFLDRRLLAARSPPHVAIQYPEFVDISGPLACNVNLEEELVFKVFQFSPSDINVLKQKATTSDGDDERISTLSVVAALIWRCKALSKHDVYDKDRVSTLFNVVNLRPRLIPPLPATYCGNPLLVAYTTAKCQDIEKQPFSETVRMVAEAPSRITDEYARSAIDWLEINRGFPLGEYMLSSWLQLGLEEVVFPWGKPLHCGPLFNRKKDVCWIFPTPHKTVNALVSLPPCQMERFQSHFRLFFNSDSHPSSVAATTSNIN